MTIKEGDKINYRISGKKYSGIVTRIDGLGLIEVKDRKGLISFVGSGNIIRPHSKPDNDLRCYVVYKDGRFYHFHHRKNAIKMVPDYHRKPRNRV